MTDVWPWLRTGIRVDADPMRLGRGCRGGFGQGEDSDRGVSEKRLLLILRKDILTGNTSTGPNDV